MKMTSRYVVAKMLGRRVSRGEFERMFSRLVPKQLKTVKTVHGRDREGKPKSVTYNPTILVRNPASPKAKRKKAPTLPNSAT